MTDNRTTELHKLLEERGVSYQTNYLHTVWYVGPKLYDALNNLGGTLTVSNLTPEQAIAATLGSGTLTAEQVEKAIRDFSTYASYDGCTYYASGIRLQAIADELNAELGSGTCENVGGSYGSHRFTCSECGESLELAEWAFVKFCHNCGKKVKR